MNCNTACFLIDLVLPRAAELDAGERHDLETHLASCGTRAAQAQAGRLWDERLGLAMRSVPVPEGLSASIKQRLRADQRRFLIRRRLVPLAAAASLLLGGLLLWQRPLKLHTQVVELEEAKQAATRDQVNAWLRLEGLPEAAPVDLNYNHLAWYGMVELRGKMVPQLVFVTSTPQGPVHARVHLLARRRFDVTGLAAESSGNLSMALWPDQGMGVCYLIFYTGESLTPFLTGSTHIGA